MGAHTGCPRLRTRQIAFPGAELMFIGDARAGLSGVSVSTRCFLKLAFAGVALSPETRWAFFALPETPIPLLPTISSLEVGGATCVINAQTVVRQAPRSKSPNPLGPLLSRGPVGCPRLPRLRGGGWRCRCLGARMACGPIV